MLDYYFYKMYKIALEFIKNNFCKIHMKNNNMNKYRYFLKIF